MARLVTVEPVLFGFMFCVFLTFPLQEQLVYKKICQSKFNETVCKDLKTDKKYAKLESTVQKETSHWMLYFQMATTFPSMAAAMIFGPCSDKVGRRYILMLPLIGGVFESCALILNSYYNQWDLSAIFVGVVVSGFFGGYAAVLMAVFAYISDVSTESSRTLRVSLLEAMVFLGGASGELVGGILVDNAGFFIAFSFACGIHAFNLLYVIVILQESYKPPEKLKLKEAILNPKNISNSVGLFAKNRPNKQRSKLIMLMLAFFCMLMVFIGSNTVKILFALHPPLSFSPSMIGYFLAVSMIYRGIGVVGGIPVFIRMLKLNDYIMAIIGCLTTLAMFVILAFARKPWMMFVVPLIDILGGIPVPCVRSIFSKSVGKEEQGALFSAIASVEVLCAVVASVLFNNVYSATVEWHPGFCFFIIAAVLIFPIVILLYLKNKDAKHNYLEFTQEDNLQGNKNPAEHLTVNS